MGHTHGTKWNDELIEKMIWEVVEKLEIDHFPTHTEMQKALGSKSLPCKIAKDKGSLYWAEKLGLPVVYSETSFGNRYEVIAISDVFENTGLHSVQISSRHPYDLLVDNSVKIDVKVSKFFENKKNVKSFTFNLEKREPTCDIFILYCVDNEENIQKILVVPACSLLGQTQIGVGETSKWDVYKDKWSYISDYGMFFDNFKGRKIYG